MRHSLSDSERITNRKHNVTYLQIVGITEFYDGESLARAFQLQDRDIRARILEYNVGVELPSVGQRHLHLIGPLDHVVVGDNQSGGIEDHARAERSLHRIARRIETRPLKTRTEEATEEIVHRRVAVVDRPCRIDV